MWGIVLGVVALGLAAYELLTRETDAKSAGARAAPSGGCGLRPGDVELTDRWLRERFPRFARLDLPAALSLAASAYPRELWPDFAARTACALSERSGA